MHIFNVKMATSEGRGVCISLIGTGPTSFGITKYLPSFREGLHVSRTGPETYAQPIFFFFGILRIGVMTSQKYKSENSEIRFFFLFS